MPADYSLRDYTPSASAWVSLARLADRMDGTDYDGSNLPRYFYFIADEYATAEGKATHPDRTFIGAYRAALPTMDLDAFLNALDYVVVVSEVAAPFFPEMGARAQAFQHEGEARLDALAAAMTTDELRAQAARLLAADPATPEGLARRGVGEHLSALADARAPSQPQPTPPIVEPTPTPQPAPQEPDGSEADDESRPLAEMTADELRSVARRATEQAEELERLASQARTDAAADPARRAELTQQAERLDERAQRLRQRAERAQRRAERISN